MAFCNECREVGHVSGNSDGKACVSSRCDGVVLCLKQAPQLCRGSLSSHDAQNALHLLGKQGPPGCQLSPMGFVFPAYAEECSEHHGIREPTEFCGISADIVTFIRCVMTTGQPPESSLTHAHLTGPVTHETMLPSCVYLQSYPCSCTQPEETKFTLQDTSNSCLWAARDV